ncbi:hypothetical protein J5N97_006706 [Dioscorea zingiberensis]|uniref:Uncharacterized protein n=1 Tax=Dioscorea zingiberensis TaxID=325984 RepID=A0A9D5HSZ2_9LILI|nr:hypothetical protein J5N97_006706 [Dioscorea zingiberensis]
MAKLIQQLKDKFFNLFDRVKGVNNTNSQDKGGGDNLRMSHVQSRGISITKNKSDRPTAPRGPPPQTN